MLGKKEVHKQKYTDANKFSQQTSKENEGFIKPYSSTATSRSGSHYFQSKIKSEISMKHMEEELDHYQYKIKDDIGWYLNLSWVD